MKKDSNGNLWMASLGYGLIRLNPQTHEMVRFKPQPGFEDLSHNYLSYVAISWLNGKEIIWTCNDAYLYYMINGEKELHAIDMRILFPEYASQIWLRSLCADSSQNLWIASNAGIFRMDPLKQIVQSFKLPSAHTDIQTFFIDDNDSSGNSMWIGSNEEPLKCLDFSTGKFEAAKRLQNKEHRGYPSNVIRGPDGWLWLGFGYDLMRYNDITGEQQIFTRSTNDSLTALSGYVSYLFTDSKKRFWIASRGLNLYDEKTHHFIRVDIDKDVPPETKLSRNLNVIVEDDHGNLWFTRSYSGAGKQVGIARYNPETGEVKNIYRQQNKYTTFPGRDKDIMCLCIDSHHQCWIGTHEGAAVFDLNDSTATLQYFSIAEGVPSSQVMDILEMNGFIWLLGNAGITCMDPQSKKIVRTISPADGLISNRPTFISGGRHHLIFTGIGTTLQWFDLKNISRNTVAPRVYITDISIEGKSFFVNGNAPGFYNNFSLSHDQNSVTFQFAALNYTNPENNQFAYRLQGEDDDWKFSKDNFAVYSNLAGGNYQFLVKAANNDGVWNEQPVVLSFYVAPPWWRTWWFISLAVISGASLLYIFYRIRINQLKKLYAIRTKISRDLHDDMGSTLSSINMLTRLAQSKVGTEKQKTMEILEKIGDSSEKMMDNMSDIVWAINPENDSIENISVRMRQFAADVLEAKNIDFTFEVDEKILQTKLPLEVRRDFYLIFKEAVNNLAKYSECTNAALKIFSGNSHLILIVSDNGKGFDTEKNYSGNGMKNYRSRAEKIKAEFEIHSTIGKGTEVILKVPV